MPEEERGRPALWAVPERTTLRAWRCRCAREKKHHMTRLIPSPRRLPRACRLLCRRRPGGSAIAVATAASPASGGARQGRADKKAADRRSRTRRRASSSASAATTAPASPSIRRRPRRWRPRAAPRAKPRVRPRIKATARKETINLPGAAVRRPRPRPKARPAATMRSSPATPRPTAYPVSLAHAVIQVESNYRPGARGSAGEIGLMQIKPATARMMGYSGSAKGLYDPDTNIRYGMKYLARAHELGGGDTCATILRYNAGHAARRMNPVSAAYCSKVKRHLAPAADRVSRGGGRAAALGEYAGASSFRGCISAGEPLYTAASWPGGRTCLRRKVAREESPGSMETRCRITSGGGDPRESATESKPPGRLRADAARVKGWGKSPPRDWRQERHGKPHREQDRIGMARGATLRAVSSPAIRVGCARRMATCAQDEWSPRRGASGRRGLTEPGLQASWRLPFSENRVRSKRCVTNAAYQFTPLKRRFMRFTSQVKPVDGRD